jgi:type I restriction enzyme S subunit
MNWREQTLGQICDAGGGEVKTGPFGSQLHESDYSDEGTPVVMPKDILDGKLSERSIARVANEHVKRLAHHIFRVGDIVFGRRGDIGRQALITPREEGWLCGTGCLRITLADSEVDPQYLHYYLRDATVIEGIAQQAIGATLPNLNTSILRGISIRFPSAKEEQRRIASVLSAYDDLIENNTRRIAILEEMARRIYEEWFVRFRFPGHENVRMVESELGLVPEGWPLTTASNAIHINPPTKVAKEGLKPFVAMNCLADGSMLISTNEERPGNSGSKFRNDDTLFARITPCLENGKTGFVQFLPSDDAVAFGSTEFIVLRSRTLTPEFVYLLARSESFRNNAIKSMSGASGRQRVRDACFDTFLMPQPDTSILREFADKVRPMFRLIQALAKKNANLRTTRDLLLPKLISGELDVPALPNAEAVAA